MIIKRRLLNKLFVNTALLTCLLLVACALPLNREVEPELDLKEDSTQSIFDPNATEKIMTEIDANLVTYSTKKKDLTSQPSEGGEIIYYYEDDGGILMKIEAYYYGADRQTFVEYYLKDKQLVGKRETVSYYDLDALVNSGEYVLSRDEVHLYYFEANRLQQITNPEGDALSADSSIENAQFEEFAGILKEMK